MQDVIDDFNERVNEIDEYIKLLKLISQPNAKIHADGKKPKAINQTALKTMKASCFLMLYNLVESSIMDSMSALYDKMNDEGKILSDFDDYVKEIWIAQKFSNMDPFSSNQTSYRKLIKEMVEDVLTSSPIALDPTKIAINGNLDAREIRKIFIQHKIPTKVHYRALGGGELKTIKDKRNILAHGAESFAECGQQFSVLEIISIKKQTVVYLRSSLRNVKKYIDEAQYAA